MEHMKNAYDKSVFWAFINPSYQIEPICTVENMQLLYLPYRKGWAKFEKNDVENFGKSLLYPNLHAPYGSKTALLQIILTQSSFDGKIVFFGKNWGQPASETAAMILNLMEWSLDLRDEIIVMISWRKLKPWTVTYLRRTMSRK